MIYKIIYKMGKQILCSTDIYNCTINNTDASYKKQ